MWGVVLLRASWKQRHLREVAQADQGKTRGHRRCVGGTMSDYGNKDAPEGQVWVCGACGKLSKDLYGDKRISRGWDESCVLHAVLCYEEKRDGHYHAVPAAE
jgi:hypothetical protein